MRIFHKLLAFTLAETLVVMGIIGVVAALTIPNLNQSTGNRETVTKLKKIHSNLEDTFGRATAVYGPVDEWFNNLSEDDDSAEDNRFAERFTEFLKISKDCYNNGDGCFSNDDYKKLDGGTQNSPTDEDLPKILLADGTALGFYIYSTDCSSDLGASSDSPLAQTCGAILVDLDGAKGSNTFGKDYFQFLITKSGIYPQGGQNDYSGSDSEHLQAGCFTSGNGCTGWVIETGNMDYLKATKGVCSNGTELSWETTSCK